MPNHLLALVEYMETHGSEPLQCIEHLGFLLVFGLVFHLVGLSSSKSHAGTTFWVFVADKLLYMKNMTISAKKRPKYVTGWLWLPKRFREIS